MPLRVAFFGSPAFAVPTLEHLLASRHVVAGVVTQPDRPRGRGQRVTPGPVKTAAVGAGLVVLQPERLARDSFEEAFAALGADIGVVVAYGRMLPDWLLASVPRGFINVHASLLPRWRGASPIQRAVMAGDHVTGVTIMRVVAALDAGPMLASASVAIGPDDTADAIGEVLAARGAGLLVDTLDRIDRGAVTEVSQDESRATHAPKLTKADGLIDFSRPAREVHDRIRGLRPWPRAHAFIDGVRIIVHRSTLSAIAAPEQPPGTVVAASAGEGLVVACGDRRAVRLIEAQLEGRHAVEAGELVSSLGIQIGARFGPA